jgi:hypothetical protein
MPKLSKVVKSATASRILAGLAARYANLGTNRLGGVTYTYEAITAVFRAQIDAIRAVDEARAALADAVARERKATQAASRVGRHLKGFIGVAFGPDHEAFGAFGWEVPGKPGPKTVKAKLQGATKAAATRTMRGTMGKRQRKKVRGW